jgi:hypothetical protein
VRKRVVNDVEPAHAEATRTAVLQRRARLIEPGAAHPEPLEGEHQGSGAAPDVDERVGVELSLDRRRHRVGRADHDRIDDLLVVVAVVELVRFGRSLQP